MNIFLCCRERGIKLYKNILMAIAEYLTIEDMVIHKIYVVLHKFKDDKVMEMAIAKQNIPLLSKYFDRIGLEGIIDSGNKMVIKEVVDRWGP